MDETDDAYDFSEPPGRLNDLVHMVQSGDIDGTAAAVRDATSWPLSHGMIWAIIAVAAINAFANLVRRSTPLAQPMADALGEKMRQPKDG